MSEREIKITPMQQEDCEEVFLLFKKCFANAWSYQSILDMFLQPGYSSLVAWKNGEIIGYIGILTVLDEADIINVAVDPDYQRMHIGSDLLNCLLQEADRQGIRKIFLEVRISNHPAIRLYQKGGFSRSGIRKNYYKHPTEDAVIMMR